MAWTLTIAGDDFTSVVDYRTLKVDDSQEINGSILLFELSVYDRVEPLLTGREVILKDGADKEFGGLIVRTRETQHAGNRLILYQCVCI